MGILNVTPDSFSDGGEAFDPDAAVARALQMLDEGADIIDVGGESTRPGHEPVSADEEAERVAPVVRGIIKAAPSAIVSIDTRHADVARMCLELGASIVNDVSGFTDPWMQQVAVESDCGCIIMHWNQPDAPSTATRRSVQLDSIKPARVVQSSRRFTLPEEAPIMREIMGFLGDQARTLMRAGVAHDRLCIDPGPGFDKTADEDIVVQRATRKLVSMGYPVINAVSRKRFVGAISGEDQPEARDAATLGVAVAAIESGARILRVHDVKSTVDFVNAYWATAKKDPRQGFVSLGSNVGDRLDNLSQAVRMINQIPLTCVVAVSHVYETEPAYGIATPVANAVVEIRTELHPTVLMDALLEVENQLHRTRDEAEAGHGPRTIDCDLCWIEGEEHHGGKLELPHPGLGERDYVLVPLEDLMADPVRFLTHAGIDVREVEDRVGHVMADLGPIAWQEGL
jgi:dihydropteroate synthase/2-amino-4-hydroxy-6-hydroxymethyldihydropteridine diphosphokinase